MKHYSLGLFLLIVMLCSSCKKDNTTGTPTGTPLLKSVTFPGVSQPQLLTYDGSGRIVSDVSAGSSSTTFTYSTNSVLAVNTNSITGTTVTTVYTLGSNGYANSAVVSVTGSSQKNLVQFVYDSEGHLTNESHTDSATGNLLVSIAYTWTNGNMTKKAENSGVVFDYTYHSDIVSTTEYANRGMSWLGKGSLNAKASETESGTTENYTYTLDSEYRITSQTTVGGGTVAYTYY